MNTTPLSNRPKLTQQDLDIGYVMRYFVQHISTKAITEIDATQFAKFQTNPRYETLQLEWYVMGLANDKRAKDGKLLYGTKHKNTVTTVFYNERMPGLIRKLRNPLEYFNGVYNVEREVRAPQPSVSSNVTITPAAGPAEPIPLVWTTVALDTFTDTNGTTIQTHTPDLGFTGWVQPSSGGSIQIQGNRARQTSSPFGGRRWFVTTSDIVYDGFKFYADIFPSSGGSEIGMVFRNNGGYTNSTVAGNNIDGIELATTSVAGSGESTTVRLALRAHENGIQGGDFWSDAAVPIPNYVTAGARFEVTVSGNQVEVVIRPAGGGTAHFTEQGITIPSPVFDDSGHAKFGFRYGSSAIPREYDNFTVQTLQ